MRSLISILALSCLLAACGDDTSPTAPSPFPASVTLPPGERANVGGLIVVFERVVADSRCPADVQCVQAGEATLAISLSTGGVGSSYEIAAVNAVNRRVVYRDYEIYLATLQPARNSLVPTNPASYRATFTVTKP